LRGIIGMALAIALTASIAAPSLADTTTGNISGTVTSGGQPAAGVTVTAVAPSGRYTARTDAKGFFSIVGAVPDTYTITFSGQGYNAATVNGVTVAPTQTTTVNQAVISTALQKIGSTTSRSTGISAFQPQQPIDTYTVNSNQIDTLMGKAHATAETDLLAALPGVSLDINGYPVLRGGRENDEGFQFEGIDYTDAFSNQFVNTLALNGVSTFQISPGAGDASIGNAGTGQINATVKRGSYPHFGAIEQDIAGPSFDHELTTEYGFASPNGRFSNYFSFNGSAFSPRYGRGQDLISLGLPITRSYEPGRDIVNNAVWKFGHDNHESLQAFYQNQWYGFFYNANWIDPNHLPFVVGNRFWNASFPPTIGVTPAEANSIVPLEIGQQFPGELLHNRPARSGIQPNATMKLQYSNAIDAATFLTAKVYKVNASSDAELAVGPDNAYQFGALYDIHFLQGGIRDGATLDLTRQVGSRHLVGAGLKYDFLHPVFAAQSSSYAIRLYYVNGGGPQQFWDFLPASSPSCAALAASLGSNPCGYLSAYFPGGVPRMPPFISDAESNRRDFAYYLQDQFQATDRLKLTYGVRIDSTRFDYPPNVSAGAYLPASGLGYTSENYLPVSTGLYTSGPNAGLPNPALDRYGDVGRFRYERVVEPRFAFAYQFGRHDSITASYGRSTELPPAAQVDARIMRAPFAPFKGIPANLAVCGPTYDRACRDYSDQLYWEQEQANGPPIEPLLPATFNNFDASYQHDFGHGVAVKVTPFYRRGYNVFAAFAGPLIVNGAPLVDANGNLVPGPSTSTNLGVSRTTGAELYLTKTAANGLSGSLSLTYVNEFTNVIPLSTSEDYAPVIPYASLALGNLYRVGFISPFSGVAAVQYKTRNGWRVNPILGFDIGYPYGVGRLTPISLNGKLYNLPNTNVTTSQVPVFYVDPANPGTVFRPNVAASRGTPEKNDPGGVLTQPRINLAAVTLEYSKPGSRNTLGVQVANFFNQVYAEPQLNGRWQPVATGIGGPKTGTSSFFGRYGPGNGFTNYGPALHGNQPYLLDPTGLGIRFRFYYQLAL
jgi:hypothetical protein